MTLTIKFPLTSSGLNAQLCTEYMSRFWGAMLNLYGHCSLSTTKYSITRQNIGFTCYAMVYRIHLIHMSLYGYVVASSQDSASTREFAKAVKL